MENKDLNIQEINKTLQHSYIHYDPNRVDYSINNLELELLEKEGSSIWKDFFIATIAIAIPSLINGYSAFQNLNENQSLTSELFLNTVIGSVCLILAVICFIVWRTNRKRFKKIIRMIREKPKYLLPNNINT